MVGETKPISKIIIEAGGDEYVFEGGGGGQPGPNTVGTEQIIDDSVELEDLNTEVKDKMTNHYDAQGEGIVLGGLVANNSQDVGQGGSEDSDDDETGFENNADTFSAGTAPTLAKSKAITAVGTGEAAAQTFTGTEGTVTVS